MLLNIATKKKKDSEGKNTLSKENSIENKVKDIVAKLPKNKNIRSEFNVTLFCISQLIPRYGLL